MKKSITLILISLCMSIQGYAQSMMVENRIPQQVLGGVVGGVLGGAAGGLTGRLMAGNNPEGFQDVAGVVVGVMVGFTIGNGAGVYYMGNTPDAQGRLWATMLGSTVGLVVGVGVGANMGEALLPVAATSVMLGSMVGYNLTRRSVVAFLQPATKKNVAEASIRTPMSIPDANVALVQIRW